MHSGMLHLNEEDKPPSLKDGQKFELTPHKGYMQMGNKHMKRYYLVIWEAWQEDQEFQASLDNIMRPLL